MDLKGKTAIVTGSAKGIGKAIALAFAREGCNVVVSDVSEADCAQAVGEAEALGAGAVGVKCDVSVPADAKALVEKAVAAFGSVDVLVNNAGIYPYAPFLDMTEAQWDKVITINLKGTFLCSQAAARQMAKQGRGGRIINIASIAASVGFPALSHYCASKGGIAAFTRALALELGPQNITVNAIAPGPVDTPGTNLSATSKEQLEQTIAAIPLKRIGRPEDIADAAVFLAKSDNATGSVLTSDGGWTAQ
jgi:3-oxoacyl-[acyl-carrier protein] reductase